MRSKKTAAQYLLRHRIAVSHRMFSFTKIKHQIQAIKHHLLTEKVISSRHPQALDTITAIKIEYEI